MQAYQSTPCLYCGVTTNPPNAQTCANCHNLLPSPPSYGQAIAPSAPAVTIAPVKPGFYRSPLRTFLFALVGSDAYVLWWTFQLLGFAQRERFPKSASPWWILFPFMNLVYISRAFRGLEQVEKAALGRASFSVVAVNVLYLLGLVLNRVSTKVVGMLGLSVDVGMALSFAVVLTMVQRSANRYQASVHSELGPAPTGLAGRYTWGEIVALAIGGVLTLLVVLADLFPS